MDVGDVATWVASVASGVTLLSSFIIVMVNRRRNEQQAERTQAKRISIWYEVGRMESGESGHRAHIKNNSDALISQPWIYARGNSLLGVNFHKLTVVAEEERIGDEPITHGVMQPGEQAVAVWQDNRPLDLLVSFMDDAGKLWEYNVRERLLSAIQFPKLPGEAGKRLKRTLRESRKKEKRANRSR